MAYSMIKTILIEKEVQRYCYLILYEDVGILIDPGSKHHLPQLLEGIKKYTSLNKIKYIILQSNDFLNVSSLSGLVEAGFKGKLIVKETGLPYLDKILEAPIETIEDLNYKLKLTDNQELIFIETPFLPFPETYATYFKEDQVLFSGHFASQNIHDNQDIESLTSAIHAFHESVMPSSEFLRHAIKNLKGLKINRVYPRIGYPIRRDAIPSIIRAISNYDFYNTQQVILRKNKKNRSYNYIAICNHMLKRLETLYERQEIMNVFKGSTVKLVKTPILEIDQTNLTGYKLWNGFFEIIYDKKGIVWLNLLAPLVRKYHHLYHIKLPVIYQTKLLDQEREIHQLDEDKTDLENKVHNLTSKVSETLDQLSRCPITGLYNEEFLKQHLINNLEQPLNDEETRALLHIQIDNLAAINQKYGNEIGNETLRNLVYIIERIKHEESLIFKQKGPGVVVYKHRVNRKLLNQFALNLRNGIQESTVFIEPITVSMSIVTHEELDETRPKASRVNQFIELGTMRLERAKAKGIGQVLDNTRDNEEYVEGLILLIDEDETNQNLMTKVFERINYSVLIAKDIYEAYQIVETHKIDVIISEINLSKLDGFQFKRRLNESQSYKNIPFIIVSHHKNLEVIMRCNLLSVDAILQKPIIPEELIGLVQRYKLSRMKA